MKKLRAALLLLIAALCAVGMAAAEFQDPASFGLEQNCREMAQRWFGETDTLLLYGAAAPDTPDNSAVNNDTETGNPEEAAVLLDADGLEVLPAAGTAALSAYFSAREAEFRDEALLFSDTTEDAALAAGAPVSGAVLLENEERETGLAAFQDGLNLLITDAAVRVRPYTDHAVFHADGTVTLFAYEWTFFDYDDLSDGPGGNDVSGFGTWHKLTLAETDGQYRVVSDEYDESDLFGVSTLGETARAELQAYYGVTPEGDPDALTDEEAGETAGNFPGFAALLSASDDGAAGSTDTALSANGGAALSPDGEEAELLAIRYAVEYDIAAALAYSERYWSNYNPAYPNYNPYGGDCANFTSQSIKAGGFPEVECEPLTAGGWYFRTSTDRSLTWASSTNMRRWMSNNRGYLVNIARGTNNSVNNAKTNIFAGSPVYYSYKGQGVYDHTVLCVGKNSSGTPIINSHNRDRYHVVWDYYVLSTSQYYSTRVIDTVQLTDNTYWGTGGATYGNFRGYQNLGDDFYATICNDNYQNYSRTIHIDARYATNSNGTVIIDYATGGSDQIWHFERLADGSYKITSAKDGACMAVNTQEEGTAGGILSRATIIPESYDGSPSQQWYIYRPNTTRYSGYLLRASCTSRVLDLQNGEEYTPGSSLWTWARNDINNRSGIEAQVFQIQEVDPPEPEEPVFKTPTLRVEVHGTNLVITWSTVPGATRYYVQILQEDGMAVQSMWRTGSSFAFYNFSPGSYTAVVNAYNGETSVSSDSIPFTLQAETYTVSYDANGGSNAPPPQVKTQHEDLSLREQIPERSGYRFSQWNTRQNGTGYGYSPAGTYRADEEVVFYAQWTPENYTVSFDANGGSVSPERKGVTYGRPYGALPVPDPAPDWSDRVFLGWHMDSFQKQGAAEGDGSDAGTVPDSELPSGGGAVSSAPVTQESIVETAEDHILYAWWGEETPDLTPTATPTPDPNATPTPTPDPNATPTVTPTPNPSTTPTATPTPDPNVTPTATPTATPTPDPNATPTPTPTATPTPAPGTPFLSVTVEYTEQRYSVEVTPSSMPDGTLIAAAGYKNGRLADFTMMTTGSDGVILPLNGDLDTVRVMALDSETSMRPRCAAVLKTANEFISTN